MIFFVLRTGNNYTNKVKMTSTQKLNLLANILVEKNDSLRKDTQHHIAALVVGRRLVTIGCNQQGGLRDQPKVG